MIRNKTNLSQEAGNLRFYFLQERRNEIEQRENGNGSVFYDNGRKRMKQLQFLQRMLMLSVLVLRRVRMHDRNTVNNMNVCKRDDFSQIQDKDNRQNLCNYNMRSFCLFRSTIYAKPDNYLAGARFSCISQVSPVYTIGVWIARNLPP